MPRAKAKIGGHGSLTDSDKPVKISATAWSNIEKDIGKKIPLAARRLITSYTTDLVSDLDLIEKSYTFSQVKEELRIFDKQVVEDSKNSKRLFYKLTVKSRQYLFLKAAKSVGYKLTYAELANSPELIRKSIRALFNDDSFKKNGRKRSHACYCDWATKVGFVLRSLGIKTSLSFYSDGHVAKPLRGGFAFEIISKSIIQDVIDTERRNVKEILQFAVKSIRKSIR